MTLKEFASIVKDMRERQKKTFRDQELRDIEEKVDEMTEMILEKPPLWISEAFLNSIPKRSPNLAEAMKRVLP